MLNITASFRRVFSNRAFTGALLYVAMCYAFEEWLFQSPQGYFYQILMTFRPPEEVRVGVLSGVASFLFSFLFVWAALRSSRGLQVVYVILVAVASVVQYGFWKAVQRFMSSADLHIAAATPFDTWKGAGSLFFDWRFILPVVVFIVLLFVFGEGQTSKGGFARLGSVVLVLMALSYAHTFTSKTLNLGASLPSFYQTITRYSIDNLLPSQRETIRYHSPTKPQNNIVLVIDESIRGDHLSINGYERETTPFLDALSQEDSFHNWGLAVAGATCSHPSNSLILTGVRPGLDDFGKTEDYPTIFQYAKAMGYVTYYMDAQTNTFWNGLTNSDVVYLDSWIKAKDLGNDIQSDFRAADRIARIVSSGTGNFIVLNKRGVHFLYEGSYPPEAAVWGPTPGEYTSQPELVTNPYDNGLRYNVNTFFERLLADPDILEHTTILYTSDHGQTLFENNVSWLHCNATLQEATVPLFLIGNGLTPPDGPYAASHDNIFPTLLDLMNIPAGERLHLYAPSLLSADARGTVDRFFFDGALRLVDFPDASP